MNKKSKLRIAKFISNAGISSRRGAEKLILEGKVEVNGQLIKSPALNVNKQDIVKVDGKIIEYDLSVRMWIFYKPKGCLVTASDPKDRKTIYDILPQSMKNINAVGRLDFNSEGLLLLTNNGDFSRYLELPKNNFERLYKVRVFGKVREDLLLGLSKGIKIDGIRYKPIKALLEKENGSNSWLKFSIYEGKNKEIRKVCKSMNLEVNRLIRYSYGPFKLKKLKKGQIEETPSFILKKKLPNFFKNKED
jgi:23S rRNA pseudouridine2605 synthase